MTENELSQYLSIKHEIKDLNNRIKIQKSNDNKILAVKVTGSSTVYPYIKRTFTIIGEDLDYQRERRKKHSALMMQRRHQLNKLLEIEENIERFVADIPDSTTRQIIRYCYIDGLTQAQAAQKVHLDQSNVSRKITDLFKNA